MKTVKCNVLKPDYMKIAAITGHKLTSFKSKHTKEGVKTFCKLDGVSMPTAEAKRIMLKDVRIVYMFTGEEILV